MKKGSKGIGQLVISRIKNRIEKQNKNWMCIVCGPTGSGKSYLALKLAEILDPDFNIDNVVFTPKGFMDLLNSGKLKKGSAIIFDEAGAGIGARDFASIANKLMMKVAQTFRSMNHYVIFTVPNFSMIDTQARKLTHAYIETCTINRAQKICEAKYFNIQVNPKTGDDYTKFDRLRKEDGRIQAIGRVQFGLASEILLFDYEEKKEIYLKELSKDVERTIAKERRKSLGPKLFDLEKVAEEIINDPTMHKQCISYTKDGVAKPTRGMIQILYPGIPIHKASTVARIIRNKLNVKMA